MKRLVLAICLVLFIFCFFLEHLPAQPLKNSADEYSKLKSAIRTGMTKEELYKIYPESYRVKDFKKNNYEVIVFDDYFTDEPDDSFTFVFKEGKLEWWDRDSESLSPEERSEFLKKRMKHAKPIMNEASDSIYQQLGGMRRDDRLNATGRSREQKMFKERYQ